MYVECPMILLKDVKMNGRAMLGRALTLVITGSLSEIKKNGNENFGFRFVSMFV